MFETEIRGYQLIVNMRGKIRGSFSVIKRYFSNIYGNHQLIDLQHIYIYVESQFHIKKLKTIIT